MPQVEEPTDFGQQQEGRADEDLAPGAAALERESERAPKRQGGLQVDLLRRSRDHVAEYLVPRIASKPLTEHAGDISRLAELALTQSQVNSDKTRSATEMGEDPASLIHTSGIALGFAWVVVTMSTGPRARYAVDRTMS